MDLKHKVLKSKQINESQNLTTIKFYREEKTMSNNDLFNIIRKFENRGLQKYDNFKIMYIRALNGDKWSTIKTEQMDDLYDIEEYYRGKVKETNKFMEFSQACISFEYSPKK